MSSGTKPGDNSIELNIDGSRLPSLELPSGEYSEIGRHQFQATDTAAFQEEVAAAAAGNGMLAEEEEEEGDQKPTVAYYNAAAAAEAGSDENQHISVQTRIPQKEDTEEQRQDE
ncbi:hypothetical protein H4S04_004672 [Coemansia sp. S16]|nr:hypothetical protein H4S04_004672 [Coemansia sp. S16]